MDDSPLGAMSSFVYASVGPEFFNKKLSEAFEFNYPDLVKNREGRLARHQLRRLIWSVASPLVRTILGCLALFLVYVLLAKFIGQGGWVKVLQISLLLALSGGVVRTCYTASLFFGDLIRGKVWTVEGRLEPSWIQDEKKAVNQHETGSRTVTKYRFAVADEHFEVPEFAFRILADNFEAGLPTVRVYFTPSSKRILSIEAISVEELVLKPEQMKKKKKPVSIWKS
jgi:hypothetical protein